MPFLGASASASITCNTVTAPNLQDGVSLPSYRGDIINGPEFTEEARIPNPVRLVRAYNQSAATMNLLRAFSTGGYAGLDRVTQWNLDFMEKTPEGEKYQDVARRVDESIQFMKVAIYRFALFRCWIVFLVSRINFPRRHAALNRVWLRCARRSSTQLMSACCLIMSRPLPDLTQHQIYGMTAQHTLSGVVREHAN